MMNLLIRRAVVAAAVAFGALFALGSVVAVLFELQGFGDRDGDPSTSYLALLALGFAASVGIPLLLWRALMPGASTRGLAAGAVLAASGAFLILGLSLR
jgi:hypothetical protein